MQTRQFQAMLKVGCNKISPIKLFHSVCEPTTDYIYFTNSAPNDRLITSAPGVTISNEAYTRGSNNAGHAFINTPSIWNCAGLCHKATGCSGWSYLLQDRPGAQGNKCKLFDSKVNKNTNVPGQGAAADGNAPMFVSGDVGCGGMAPFHKVPHTSLLFQASKSF